jgi:hypothetical protein
MNKILAFFFTALIFLIFSCKSHINKESDLLGSWRIDNVEVNQKMSADEKANFNLYLSQLQELAYFNFKKDHTYESNFSEDVSTGIWSLTNNGNELITQADTSDADTFKITKLNATTFIILSESDGVVSKITMKKQK